MLSYDDMGRIGGWRESQIRSMESDDASVIKTGQAIHSKEEEPFIDSDSGEAVYYISDRVPVKSSSGEVVGIIGISHDITVLKKAEEELKNYALAVSEKAQKIHHQFLENMQHDMGTPLYGLLGVLDVAQRENDIEEVHDLIKMAHDSGKRMNAFFDTLLMRILNLGGARLILQPIFALKDQGKNNAKSGHAEDRYAVAGNRYGGFCEMGLLLI